MALSIPEARDILGPDGEGLSDDEIQSILISLSILAKDLLDGSGERNL